jgi:hypothetical protein
MVLRRSSVIAVGVGVVRAAGRRRPAALGGNEVGARGAPSGGDMPGGGSAVVGSHAVDVGGRVRRENYCLWMLIVCCRLQSSAKARSFYSATGEGLRSTSARPRARVHWGFAGSFGGLPSRTTRPPRVAFGWSGSAVGTRLCVGRRWGGGRAELTRDGAFDMLIGGEAAADDG